jgi:hypothetical protein
MKLCISVLLILDKKAFPQKNRKNRMMRRNLKLDYLAG